MSGKNNQKKLEILLPLDIDVFVTENKIEVIDDLTLQKVIGNGVFGTVFYGSAFGSTPVAGTSKPIFNTLVKVFKSYKLEEALKEVKLMRYLVLMN